MNDIDIPAAGRRLMGMFAVCAVAWFFGGLTALVAAAAGLLIARMLGPTWVAVAASGSLLVAAIATVLEAQLEHSYSVGFAAERPIAVHAALVAGALAFVAVVVFAARQRPPVASESLPPLRWRAEPVPGPDRKRRGVHPRIDRRRKGRPPPR